MIRAPFDRKIQSYQRLLLPKTPAEFKRSLEKSSGRRIELTMTHNHRSMLRSIPLQSGRILVRAHNMFLYAPPTMVSLVGRYIANPLDRIASHAVDFFISGELDRIDAVKKTTRQQVPKRTRGRHFNLREIFQSLNEDEFEGQIQAGITWSKGKRLAKRSTTILFGSFTPGNDEDPGLIRIHPALDQEFVPKEFVEFVVFHEMIHVVIPVRLRDGRRVVHPPEFRERERKFRHYEFATKWENHNLHRFIG
ncbi:MAG: hypothetical protein P1V97_02020 [Planctomycetota bacterium]|nr:hypothetical protein [Planctomycetota bacterium]